MIEIEPVGDDRESFAVTFTVARPDLAGRELAVVGDFNDWDRRATPMQEIGDATWTAVVHLSPGLYRFRYLTPNGQCLNDENADDHAGGDFGGRDSILDLTSVDVAG
jgi:1,4-alpha-glucan branching enzyme